MAGTVGTSAGPARAGSEAARAAPFRFAPTFIVDFIVSSFYAGLFLYCWPRASHTTLVCVLAGALGAAIALCYFGKVFIIGFLNRRGGDARTYVISSDLVTTGLYAYSRNPTYLLTLVQDLLWSALLVFLQAFAPLAPIVACAVDRAAVVFFLSTIASLSRARTPRCRRPSASL